MTWHEKYKLHLQQHTTLSYGTIEQHISRLRRFAAWLKDSVRLADVPAQSITKIRLYGRPAAVSDAQVRDYFEDVSEDHPADFRQHIKTALRTYYGHLLEEGAIKRMPDLDIPIRKNGKDRAREPMIVTDQHVASVRKHFKPNGSVRSLRDQAMIECLIELGIRVHELLLLRPEDFDIKTHQVSVRSTKTEGKSKYGGNRIMPLPASLNRTVRKYLRKDKPAKGEAVFRVGSHNVWRIVKKAGAAIHLPWLSTHKFRHHCITRFSQVTGSDGITPVFSTKELSTLFGVSPEIIAKRYDHPSAENIVSKALKSGVYSQARPN